MTITREYTSVTSTPYYYAKQGSYIAQSDTRAGALAHVLEKMNCAHVFKVSQISRYKFCTKCNHMVKEY